MKNDLGLKNRRCGNMSHSNCNYSAAAELSKNPAAHAL